MATLVCFHAHPDDEAITTGGVMAKYAAAGHRVVLVVATGGEHGEVPDDLAPGEALADRRRAETEASAGVLGLSGIRWLGYTDSGMDGWEQNDHEHCFWQAPVEEAAERLAAILRAEAADVLTVYDAHGNYGHPDHIQVHRVGHRAAELAGVRTVYEATMNRDEVRRQMILFSGEEGGEPPLSEEEIQSFGSPEDALTTAVDVSSVVGRKRAAVACHRSQVTDSSFLLQMPEEAFAVAFGTEWFIRKGAPPGIREHELEGLG